MSTGCPLIPRLRGWCAIGVCAALSACGGRAADGLLPDGSGPAITNGSGPTPPDRRNPTSDDDAPTVDNPVRDPQRVFEPRRETCEDNPLLAGCALPVDICRDSPQNASCPPEPEPEPEPEPPVDQLLGEVAAAQNVLVSHCGGCHGPALTPNQASASFNYVDDWDRLIDVGMIERCSPERSPIIERMRTGDMPPVNSGLPPVPEADINVVEVAINLDCTVD
jgi:hypothetical protein